MTINESQQQKPWAINKTILCISLGLAVLTEAEALFAALFAMKTGQHSGLIWLVAAVWPAYYGFIYFVAYGMALIDQRGSITRQMGSLGSLFGPFRHILDSFYRTAPNVALILFPVLGTMIGAVLAWCAVTRQIN